MILVLLVAMLVAISLPARPARATGILACILDERPWGRGGAGTFVGIYQEVIAELAKKSGRTIATEVSPRPRVVRDVANGHCQFTIFSWDNARATLVARGEVLVELDYELVLRAGLKAESYQDMAGHTIAWSRGLLIGSPFDDDPAITRFATDGYDQAISMLKVGRADAVVGSTLTLEGLVRRHGDPTQFGGRIFLTRAPLAIQFEKSFAATPEAARLNQAVREMRESGQAAEIIRHHFADMTD